MKNEIKKLSRPLLNDGHPAYRKDIDGLRAIAVASVLLFHAFPSLLPGGFIGVDIFFVISGFLITTILVGSLELNRFSITEFYSRRIRRIFPALIVVFLASFVAAWTMLLPQDFIQFGTEMLAGAAFVSNFVLWHQAGYFDAASVTKPFLHLWSLAIEEQFYVVWPVALFLVWKWNRRLAVMAVVATVFSFVACVALTMHDPVAGFYSPVSRFWELMIGALLSFFMSSTSVHSARRLVERFGTVVGATGLVLFTVGFVVLDEHRAFPGYWALLPTVGACLVIAAGPQALLNRFVLGSRPMVWIGSISYPLYLWHWPLLVLGRRIPTFDADWRLRGGALVVAVILAWLTFKVVERPLRFSIRPRYAVSGLAASMMVMASISGAAVMSNGFLVRLPADLRPFATPIDFQWQADVRSGTCFIQEVSVSTRPSYCIEKQRPLVALWGDSFGGAFYQGLHSLQENHSFGVAQLTQSACPPLLNVSFEYRKNCADINKSVLESLKELQPQVLVMVSAWTHGDYWMEYPAIVEKVGETLGAVKATLPNTKIVVVGPAPMWNGRLQDVMLKYYTDTPGHPAPPQYMLYGRIPRPQELDPLLREAVKASGVEYISLLDLLCNQSGCLTRVGSQATDLTAIDFGHLSLAGARYVAQKMAGEILPSK
ncbi:acyltransferase family protein [Caballeronia sp. LZ062]|uniref:acyltransferase family protein n=1 Tax=unclassified Caballeronia TaxID=2646786 RepID=UPI00285F2849|nr:MULTISPECIES: acyltransferase family protein [unclassified Caballeronia]MDR5854145.1 acyltransferase family protein [Caballeronia sp. LZ050]MDR5871324.1 acyltransferase family protein [Caballeronia sp. LZ062]